MKALLYLFTACVGWAEVQPRTPVVSSVYPQGTVPGSTVEVEILGEYLDRAQRLVFHDDGLTGKILSGSYGSLRAELTLRRDAALGPHYFQVVTPRGASGVMLFRAGDQPHILEREPDDSPEDAQEIAIPATVNGRLNTEGDFDFFRFRARKGETWVFDLRASRNGNGLDAALILLDERGRRLENCEEFFIWDPFFTYTFAADGRYTVVVQPLRTDPTFAYQLDVRRAPHLATIAPIAVRPGSTVEATVYGAGLVGTGQLWTDAPGVTGEVLEMRGDTARIRLAVPHTATDGPRELAILTDSGRSSAATFLIDSTPAYRSGELLRAPMSLTGIARYRQPERFPFDAAEGQKLVFEVRAQRFGSPVDSVLRILDEKGEEIAKNDDGAFAGAVFNKDSRLSHTFERGGRYHLEIANLYKTTGENYPYQLVMRSAQPGFDVLLNAENPYVFPGGDGSLKVSIARRDGFEGPVKLTVEGLPEGIQAEGLEVPEGIKEATIRFRAGELPPGTMAQVRVHGGDAQAWRSARIASGGGEGATFARIATTTLVVAEMPLFSLEPAATAVTLVRGGSVEVPVVIQRADGFAEPVEFSFDSLPEGVTAERTVAEGGATQVSLRLTASADASKVRFPRALILGKAVGGQVQEAPKIAITVD